MTTLSGAGLALSVFSLLSTAVTVAAQVPPQAAAHAAPGPAMLATERYLFVIRDDVLFQFDIDTLELRHSVALPRAARQARGAPVPRAVAPTPLVGPEVVVTPLVDEPAVDAPAVDATALRSAITAGAGWLAAHQDDDGKWDCDGFMQHDTQGDPCDGPGSAVHDVGVTGLALLALLGEGSTLRAGSYKENIKRAVNWLRDQQQENGLFGTNASQDFIYDHAIASYAITETYGRSSYKALQRTAQHGIDYLESHRNPYAVWRYQPRDNDNDTSVTIWCIMACESARRFKLDVNENALKLSATWLDQVTDPSGRAGYTKAGEPSSRHAGGHVVRFPPERGEAMTAAALFGRTLLGQDAEQHPIMTAAAQRILAKPPHWDRKDGSIDAYYWFMASRALSRMGGRAWSQWSQSLPQIATAQRRDGNFAGSWDAVGVWDEDGGRVYATALYTLALASGVRLARPERR